MALLADGEKKLIGRGRIQERKMKDKRTEKNKKETGIEDRILISHR